MGETVSVPGGWIGFPAHRHDYERPGKECVLDEIFSFQMTSTEDGPGRGGVMQHGYDLTDENKKIWDEVNVIEENNTAVALPPATTPRWHCPAPVRICCGAWPAIRRSTRSSLTSGIPGLRAAYIEELRKVVG